MRWLAQNWDSLWSLGLVGIGGWFLVRGRVGYGWAGRPDAGEIHGWPLRAIAAAMIAFGLWMFVDGQLAIDRCLDHGGRWDYEGSRCVGITR